MKKTITLVLMLASAAASAQVPVRGYVKKDGTYVAPSMRSTPNNNAYDNYSAKGNVNPYSGKEGRVEPSDQYKAPAPSYQAPKYETPHYEAPRYDTPSYEPKKY